MKKKNATTFGIRAFICCSAILALWRCSDPPHSPPRDAPEVPCGNVNNCITYADAGRCADRTSPKCVAADAGTDAGECLYGFKATASCVCIEGSARICTLDAGVMGVQMCDPQNGDAGTQWGPCQMLNQ